MDPNRSLQDLFYDLRELNASASGDKIREGVRLCYALTAAVDAAQLFSSNESAEEIATADLKFLLLPFYHATLLSRCEIKDPSTQAEFLKTALKHCETFLSTLWDYELCGQTAKDMFWDEEKLLKGGVNVSVSREQKIARSKRERQIKAEIDRMRGVEVDEAQEREVWFLELEAAFLKAVSDRDMLRQEIQIVEFAARTNDKRPENPPAGPEDSKTKVSTVVHNLAQTMQKREELKQQVFRPSHILPTMTVEQFGELEFQRAQAAQDVASAQVTQEQDSDEEVYSARAWDDWKDDHPRGCGNSKLKPCS